MHKVIILTGGSSEPISMYIRILRGSFGKGPNGPFSELGESTAPNAPLSDPPLIIANTTSILFKFWMPDGLVDTQLKFKYMLRHVGLQ